MDARVYGSMSYVNLLLLQCYEIGVLVIMHGLLWGMEVEKYIRKWSFSLHIHDDGCMQWVDGQIWLVW